MVDTTASSRTSSMAYRIDLVLHRHIDDSASQSEQVQRVCRCSLDTLDQRLNGRETTILHMENVIERDGQIVKIVTGTAVISFLRTEGRVSRPLYRSLPVFPRDARSLNSPSTVDRVLATLPRRVPAGRRTPPCRSKRPL